MALPASGPISFGDIRAQFRGASNTSSVAIGDYYAGGAYVPSGTTGTNGAVPSSGPLIVPYNFYGTAVRSTVGVEEYTLNYGPGDVAYWAGYDNNQLGGYSPGFALGTFTPPTLTFLSGATVNSFIWYSYPPASIAIFAFVVAGNVPNSGWTTMNIQGYGPINRTAMSYTYNSMYNVTQWGYTADPFPNPVAPGTSKTVTWTV